MCFKLQVNKNGLLPQLPVKGIYQKCRNDLDTGSAGWSKLKVSID